MTENKHRDAYASTCRNIDKSFDLTGMESILVRVAVGAVMDAIKSQLEVCRTPSDRARLARAVAAHVKALVESAVAEVAQSGEVRL